MSRVEFIGTILLYSSHVKFTQIIIYTYTYTSALDNKRMYTKHVYLYILEFDVCTLIFYNRKMYIF